MIERNSIPERLFRNDLARGHHHLAESSISVVMRGLSFATISMAFNPGSRALT